MKIMQKRHGILEEHRGERFTPAQLKAEFRKTFPEENPSSINAADCFNTPGKKAGCTCNECTRLGGFAVNRDGIVDMGASGFGGTSSVYIPTGNTRASTQRAVADAAFSQPRMSDPLSGFDWNRVCARYDAACCRFSSLAPQLRGPYAGTLSDRALYYKLVAAASQRHHAQLGTDWYEALLYWKLYSQPAAVSNINGWMRSFAPSSLHTFLATLPSTLSRDVGNILALVKLIGRYQLPGTKTSTSLPVRTTLLHFLYPDVVPIFDQMVLIAVGSWYKAANQDIGVLGRYIPHAWALVDRHTRHFTGFQETPIRLVDMGLWLVRNLGY
jgi:hypothetical protein